MIDIKVPAVGESISEVTLVKWLKKDGDYVLRDEVIAELESEKATFEVNAEQAGLLQTVGKEGDTLNIGDTVAKIDESAAKPSGNGTVASNSNESVTVAPPAEPTVENITPAPAAAGKGIIEIKVPTVGESISEVTLVKWVKKEGDLVNRDEVIAELESEKATFELNAEQAGKLATKVNEGDVLKIGDLVATIDSDVAVGASSSEKKVEAKPAPQPAVSNAAVTQVPNDIKATPVASAIIADKKVDPQSIKASGQNGKILKDDVLGALANPGKKPGVEAFNRNERKDKMSNLRKTVSRRLVEAKNTTAMLTTFNEVDMSKIMAIRTANKEKFKEAHGVNLGFMSFFTKAVCFGLQEWPAVNAYIDGDSIVYHDYCDISIAVG